MPERAISAELLDTILRLGALPLPDEARPLLDKAQKLAEALTGQLGSRLGDDGIDREVFHDLLEIAGRETAPKLLEQVLIDLSGVDSALREGFDRRNWAELRMQSHILMSIAGSFGAIKLHRDAETLNRMANEANATALPMMQVAVLSGLTELTAFLQDEAKRHPALSARKSPTP